MDSGENRYLFCLVCLVCLVFGLNETNQMNQINQIDQMNQTDRIDQIDERTHWSHCLIWHFEAEKETAGWGVIARSATARLLLWLQLGKDSMGW